MFKALCGTNTVGRENMNNYCGKMSDDCCRAALQGLAGKGFVWHKYVGRENTGESTVAKCEMNYCKAPTQGLDGEDFVGHKHRREKYCGRNFCGQM